MSDANGNGRPSSYTEEMAEEICVHIAMGGSLNSFCELPDKPHYSTVMRWLGDDRFLKFRDNYARAREESADKFAEEVVEIADQSLGLDAAGVQAMRLRIDARKWVAAKQKPKKYGDKLELSGDVGRPVTDEQLDSRIAALLHKLGGADAGGEAGAASPADGKVQEKG